MEFAIRVPNLTDLIKAMEARAGYPVYTTECPVPRTPGTLALEVEYRQHETDPLLCRVRYSIVQTTAGGFVPLTPFEDSVRTLGFIHAMAEVRR